jgi:hypothetical protein
LRHQPRSCNEDGAEREKREFRVHQGCPIAPRTG